MKKIRIVDPEGKVVSADVDGQTTVGQLVAAKHQGAYILRSGCYAYQLDGAPANWNTGVSQDNNEIAILKE